MAPIPSKRTVLKCEPSTSVGQSHSQGTMHNSSTNYRMPWKM